MYPRASPPQITNSSLFQKDSSLQYYYFYSALLDEFNKVGFKILLAEELPHKNLCANFKLIPF